MGGFSSFCSKNTIRYFCLPNQWKAYWRNESLTQILVLSLLTKKVFMAFWVTFHLFRRKKCLIIFEQNLEITITVKRKSGILLPKLFWPTVNKNCSSDWEKLLKFEAEGREFAKFLRSLEQIIQTVKVQNNFW